MSVLVAYFFDNKNGSNLTLEQQRVLAQSRIVLPERLFGKFMLTTTQKTKATNTSSQAFQNALTQEMKVTYAKAQLSQVEAIINELAFAQKSYERINKANLAKYQKEYDNDVKEAYSKATKVEKKYTDPDTKVEMSYFVYENLNLPEFSYEPSEQLDFSYLTNGISKLTKEIVNTAKDNFFVETIDDVIQLLKSDKDKLSTVLFENSLKTQKSLVADGMILRVDESSSYRYSQQLSISSVGNLSNKRIRLTFSGMNSPLYFSDGNFQVVFEDNTSLSYQFSNRSMGTIANLYVFDLFRNNEITFDPGVNTAFTFSGTFNTYSGQALVMEGSAVLYPVSTPGDSVNNPGSGGMYDFVVNPDLDPLLPHTSIFRTWSDVVFKQLEPFSRFSLNGDTARLPEQDYIVVGEGTYELSKNENSGGEEDNNQVPDTSNTYIPLGYGINQIGIADYRKVEQQVCCYVPGEVSHIENIMAREYKEKSTVRSTKKEETFTTTKEQEREKLTDTTTTDRFEMNQEIAEVLSEQTSFGVSANASYSGAGYSLGIGANFAHNTSQENSNVQAITQAKEITERALDRVVNKIKEERITKIVEEFTESNKHGFDNRKGDKHVSGVYRWVDKIYENKIVNYGKRLMYEFAIPEPAAFHKHAVKNYAADLEELSTPPDPRQAPDSTIATYSAIDEIRAAFWASYYNVEIDAKPVNKLTISKTFSFIAPEIDGGEYDENGAGNHEIEVPEGYYGVKAYGLIKFTHEPGFGAFLIISNQHRDYTVDGNPTSTRFSVDLSDMPTKVPVSYSCTGHHAGSVNFEIVCQLSSTYETQWKIATFNKIIAAYEAKKAEYLQRKAELKALAAEKAKMNPGFYRQIENTVLRKNCIEYLASQASMGEVDYLTQRDKAEVRASYTSSGLGGYADRVKFFEQAFEWDIMSYYFYPFYWAKKSEWVDMYLIENDDPLFRSFLQSGMARVIVTVRPGFEEAVNWYMATGEIWNGGQVPSIDDPMFLSIVDELRKPAGEVEEVWQSRVPTSLTIIQAGAAGLNVVNALPCDEECSDNLLFSSDGQEVKVFEQTDTLIGGNATEPTPEEEEPSN
ncbi:hypothetical protein M0M57_10810 [Flavobacterium azooxidireducens]|uniref:Tc toxin complex TcA C-terminal TcB-binding domain-containing protein n=1 Tax=Flavobacterium azooxidireducens TaxID=1871076 RepID=A0ABY4KEF7_9FLAO|nr:hypothetical protein [Flavobacterium azooxidireducens]UPQ78113.1 hypothetical protein M0M57_10810 [Flavobacterium azooxidireducens]